MRTLPPTPPLALPRLFPAWRTLPRFTSGCAPRLVLVVLLVIRLLPLVTLPPIRKVVPKLLLLVQLLLLQLLLLLQPCVNEIGPDLPDQRVNHTAHLKNGPPVLPLLVAYVVYHVIKSTHCLIKQYSISRHDIIKVPESRL